MNDTTRRASRNRQWKYGLPFCVRPCLRSINRAKKSPCSPGASSLRCVTTGGLGLVSLTFAPVPARFDPRRGPDCLTLSSRIPTSERTAILFPPLSPSYLRKGAILAAPLTRPTAAPYSNRRDPPTLASLPAERRGTSRVPPCRTSLRHQRRSRSPPSTTPRPRLLPPSWCGCC